MDISMKFPFNLSVVTFNVDLLLVHFGFGRFLGFVDMTFNCSRLAYQHTAQTIDSSLNMLDIWDTGHYG